MLTVKELDLVRAIAGSGSLTAAARRLHITQSAASQRLKSLSERLDVEVFEKRDGRLQATAAGRRIHAAAQVVGREIDAALRDVATLAAHDRGTLRVATQCFTCYRWLPFVIRSMAAEFPQLAVDVVPEATDRPYEALENGEIDVAVVSSADPRSDFPTQALFTDEFFAVMRTDNDLAARRYLTPELLARQPLIVYAGARHAVVDLVLKPANVTDYELVQVRITEAIVELARAGRGIAVLAGWALDDMDVKRELAAVRITRGGFKRTWRAVGADRDTPTTAAFVHALRSVGAALERPNWRRALRSAP